MTVTTLPAAPQGTLRICNLSLVPTTAEQSVLGQYDLSPEKLVILQGLLDFTVSPSPDRVEEIIDEICEKVVRREDAYLINLGQMPAFLVPELTKRVKYVGASRRAIYWTFRPDSTGFYTN